MDVDPQDISSLLHDLADMLLLPEDATGENEHGDTVTKHFFYLPQSWWTWKMAVFER